MSMIIKMKYYLWPDFVPHPGVGGGHVGQVGEDMAEHGPGGPGAGAVHDRDHDLEMAWL